MRDEGMDTLLLSSSSAAMENVRIETITTAPRPEAVRLPLWLSAGEAELLLSLSLTSPISGGEAEYGLFTRFAEFLREFRLMGKP